MSRLRFEWDDRKNASNGAKHGVTFEEASTIFTDERALLLDDPDHSLVEPRFILLGSSVMARILVVCHCYRASHSVIRIISARRANRKEKEKYANPS